jgi:hypothetical protein
MRCLGLSQGIRSVKEGEAFGILVGPIGPWWAEVVVGGGMEDNGCIVL